MSDPTKCERCHGNTQTVSVPCPDGKAGCLTEHTETRCANCTPPQPPSVGRVVHYANDWGGDDTGAPRRADIVAVHPDGTVDLAVTLAPSDIPTADTARLTLRAGYRLLVHAVYELAVKYDATGKTGTWRYPPVVR